jgi:hypothetical protein
VGFFYAFPKSDVIQSDYFSRMLDSHKCISCGNDFKGLYCNVCGEKVISPKDRKLMRFLGEFVNALTFADSKLWKTIKSIVVAPGKFSNDFVEGKRKAYMKPVSIFFLANLIYFLFPVFNTFMTNLNVQLIAFWHSGIATEMVNKEIAIRGTDLASFTLLYDQKTEELSKLFLIIMSGILALFFLPIHIGSKNNLIADHITFGLELMTFILLFCVQLLAILLSSFSLVGIHIVSDVIMTSGAIILLFYFFFKAEKIFYGFSGVRRYVNTFLCVLSVAIALTLYRTILFFITFWSI